MSERGKRHIRKYWREKQAESRLRKVNLLATTPPSTPEVLHEQAVPGPSHDHIFSVNRKSGRKRVLRNRSKLVRENLKLHKENKKLKKQTEKYKKRWQRQVFAVKDKESLTASELSPKSKTKVTLEKYFKEKITNKHPIARQLFIHNVMQKTWQDKYNASSNKKKRIMKEILASKLVKKYRLVRQGLHSYLGLSNRTVRPMSQGKSLARKQKVLFRFFERDDVSTATAGKKETITRKKEKRQKRYLTDTMRNLYKKYLKESPAKSKISYTTFTRLRPFHVISPRAKDRNTCACLIHSNLRLKVKKLLHLNAIETNDLKSLVADTVCDMKSIDCMYGKCNNCLDIDVPTTVPNISDLTTWWMWQKKREKKNKIIQGESKEIIVQTTSKEKIEGPISLLIEDFQKDIKRYKKHIFNISQQFVAYNACKNNLMLNEALIHIDFSENYSCKLGEEIQMYHFGSSRAQATLHTGVMYIGGKENPISFCTISPSNDHSPAAIWAHLRPVLELLKDVSPDISVLHFFPIVLQPSIARRKTFIFSALCFMNLDFKEAPGRFLKRPMERE